MAIIPLFRKTLVACCCLTLLTFFFSGCASSPSDTDTSSGLPSVAGKFPTKYGLVEASRTQRPEWINVIPDDHNGLHYLVGLSNYHASERDARSEAMRHAREEYAKFTGVDVSQVDEVVRSLYGRDSDIFDATVAQISKSKQATDAQVSRVKAKEFYFERFEATQDGQYAGSAYKYWILVAVPVDEYQRVQQWKAEKAALKKERLASERNAAQSRIDQALSEYQTRYAAIDGFLAAGEPMQALTSIQNEWNRLDSLEKDWRAKGGYFGEQVSELKKGQEDLVRLVSTIRSGLIIDTGRFQGVLLAPGDASSAIPVWLWQKTAKGLKPVADMPLALVNPSGVTVARSNTDFKGKATFFASGLASGIYRIGVDSESRPLSTLMAPIPEALSSVYKTMAVRNGGHDLDSAAKIATRNLFAGPANTPLKVKKLTVGPVTYADSKQGSDFAARMKNRLAEQLSKIEGLHIVLPRPRTATIVAQAIRTRGITAGKVSLGAAATQATIDRADAALETIYVLLGKDVRINLALKEAGTDRLLASSSALISETYLPKGVNLIPEPTNKPASKVVAGTEKLKLEVTTHMGDGQTFKEGEKLSFFVNTERAAHLLMIYEDAEHNLFQILPNQYAKQAFYSAGSTIQVPGPSDGFEFTITGPFGLEHVWAFAATMPWPTLAGVELENGLKLLSDPFKKVVEVIRRHGRRYDVSYGESHTMLTTVKNN